MGAPPRFAMFDGRELSWTIWIEKLVNGTAKVRLSIVISERLSCPWISRLKFWLAGPVTLIVVV